MYNNPIKHKALQKYHLLNDVIKFKNKFYSCTWANYEKAKIGTIKLLPKSYFIKDFEHMKNMIFSSKPDFDQILVTLKKLEKEINSIEIVKTK